MERPSSPAPLAPTPPSQPSSPNGLLQALRRQVLPVLAWVVLALVLRWAVLEPRWIPSGSMLPTLQLQDRVLVEKLRARLHRPVPIGSVVVFHPPPALLEAGYDPNAALIKRVVAEAGDQVEVREGVLWRNGVPAPLDWSAEPMNYQLEPLTVPPDHLLVLGDNRNASLDSHLWGPLPREAVIGTAVLRYWPLNRFGWLRFSLLGHPPGAAGELG
ncbi:MAG: signal peptidase I [Cyanobacteria bacterium M_DeepCast_100m_m1_067]|nr:signal peptidase I [Cyanobacteria bacterium M_DeepCast_100m_m1_067]